MANTKYWRDYDIPTITLEDFYNNITIERTYIKPTVDKVVFNNPATIILWKDGTKTVVKCQNGETFDEEKGFVMAYLKKLLGNDNTFNKEIKKYVKGS
jgi:hypothetical protein